MFGRESFEQRVGVRRVPDLEWTVSALGPDAVENNHAARTAKRYEARERVDELARLFERAGVEHVVAIE